MGVPVVAHLFRQLNRALVSWKMPPSVWRWLDWQGFLQGCFKGSILQMELEVRTFLNLGCFMMFLMNCVYMLRFHKQHRVYELRIGGLEEFAQHASCIILY